MAVFNPDLALGRFIPKVSFGPRITAFTNRRATKPQPVPDDIAIDDVTAPGHAGGPPVKLRVYRPKNVTGPMPALYWMHGGGYIAGDPLMDERTNILFARHLGMTVVAVTYRLAPQHPSPAAVHDAYAGLLWLFGEADARSVDPERVAIGGASAGGGLAASLALYAHDLGEVRPAFQLLVYPMLDDRTVQREGHDTKNVRVWTPGSNRYAWRSYLGPGVTIGSLSVSAYAAPARRDDLSGLPPAWIGVGSLDLFYDEDVAYAARLEAAGVPCAFETVPGAFHGFDALFTKAGVSERFWQSQADALRGALLPPG